MKLKSPVFFFLFSIFFLGCSTYVPVKFDNKMKIEKVESLYGNQDTCQIVVTAGEKIIITEDYGSKISFSGPCSFGKPGDDVEIEIKNISKNPKTDSIENH